MPLLRFESQLLNGEKCKDRQRFMRCSHKWGESGSRLAWHAMAAGERRL